MMTAPGSSRAFQDKNMKKFLPVAALAMAALGGAYYLTRPPVPLTQNDPQTNPAIDPGDESIVEVTLPAELSGPAQIGKRAFDGTCAACHGANASGRIGYGPPLVHKVYEPGHHGDMAFYMAVQNGVRAHHWPFGDMPAQSGLTRADVSDIIAYVREMQRANGID